MSNIVKINQGLPTRIEELLREFKDADQEKVQELIAAVLSTKLTLIDLWEEPELSVSYWILLLSGINQHDEMEIAKNLLIWKAFAAEDSAKLLCVPFSKRHFFKVCSAQFQVTKTPTLLIGNGPNMENFVKVDGQLLFTLNAHEGHFHRFLTEIHNSLQNGQTLNQVKTKLLSEKFWRGTKVVYQEVKSVISFSF